MSYKDELSNKLISLSTEMHAIVDKAKSEGNRGLTSEEAEKFDRMEADYSSIEASIVRARKADDIENALSQEKKDNIASHDVDLSGGPVKENPRYASVFRRYLAFGTESLNSEERNILRERYQSNLVSKPMNTASTSTGSQGGYIVPTGFSDQLEVALKYFGGILGEVSTFDTETGAPLPWPTMNDTSNKGRIIGQNVQVTNTDLVFGQVNFSSYIFSSDILLLPLALLQDSYFDLDAVASQAIGQRIGRLINNKLTVGSGSGEPTGLVTAAVAAGNVVDGASGETTTLSFDDFTNLEHAVDPIYRSGAKYMFHDSTLKAIKKLKDSANRPLWLPVTQSVATNSQPTINDHPYIINNDVPVMAASANSVLFGDFTKYKFRRVGGGVTVLRLNERYADYLQQGIVAFLRADGNLLDAGTHPVAVLQNAAS
jgi:HK97 family phage major capsid protein